MNVHKNARLTEHSRADLVRRVQAGQPAKAVATAVGVDAKTVGKWVKRFEAEGPAGLADRSSRPHRLHQPTPAETVDRVIVLRRQRFCGRQIAKKSVVKAWEAERS